MLCVCVCYAMIGPNYFAIERTDATFPYDCFFHRWCREGIYAESERQLLDTCRRVECNDERKSTHCRQMLNMCHWQWTGVNFEWLYGAWSPWVGLASRFSWFAVQPDAPAPRWASREVSWWYLRIGLWVGRPSVKLLSGGVPEFVLAVCRSVQFCTWMFARTRGICFAKNSLHTDSWKSSR